MKNTLLFYLALVLLTSFSCDDLSQEQAIGKIVNDKAILTIDEATAKKNFEKFLKEESNIQVNFDEIKIVQQENSYVLTGLSQQDKTQSAFELIVIGGQIFELTDDKRTVTCTGCTAGCSPYGTGDTWICKNPCDDCEKTETVTTGKSGSVLHGRAFGN